MYNSDSSQNDKNSNGAQELGLIRVYEWLLYINVTLVQLYSSYLHRSTKVDRCICSGCLCACTALLRTIVSAVSYARLPCMGTL